MMRSYKPSRVLACRKRRKNNADVLRRLIFRQNVADAPPSGFSALLIASGENPAWIRRLIVISIPSFRPSSRPSARPRLDLPDEGPYITKNVRLVAEQIAKNAVFGTAFGCFFGRHCLSSIIATTIIV